MSSDHRLYRGTDPFTGEQYLLTVWDGGGIEVAHRSEDWHTWSPPVEFTEVPAEVSS
jgi:hypothetical protein